MKKEPTTATELAMQYRNAERVHKGKVLLDMFENCVHFDGEGRLQIDGKLMIKEIAKHL